MSDSVYEELRAPATTASDTSVGAAQSLSGNYKATIYRLVVNHVRFALWSGKTREEISKDLGLSGDTVRPRIVEAIRNGDLIETERVRLTKAGRKAAVLICQRKEPV